MKGNDIATLVIAGIGVISVVIGVITYLNGFYREARKADETKVCSDPNVMRGFATEKLGFCSYYFWRSEAQTAVPKVPTLEKLLNLGDDLFYTSKAFDHARPPASPKEATWVWLYNTILEEVFRKRPDQDGDLDLVMKSPPSKEKRMKDCDEKDPFLLKLVHGYLGTVPEYSRRLWEQRTWQFLDDEKGLVRCTRLFPGWESQFSLASTTRRQPEEDAVRNWLLRWMLWMVRLKSSRQAEKDKRYLPRWMPPSNGAESSGSSEHNEQMEEEVVWSISRSARAQAEARQLHADPEETPFHTRLRVIAEKPYIQISREQLYSLALSLGGPLHWDPQASSYRASAAFGIDITVEYQHREGFWRARLDTSKRRQRHPQAKGSGYSILFAKHMACGLIPFERSIRRREYVKSVYISPDVLEALFMGAPIQDEAVNMYGDELEYVRQLPYSKWTYLWPHGRAWDLRGKKYIGQILDHKRKNIVGFWWDAVCGIAFGGLVPQVTAELKQAVQFTMAGLHQIANEENDQLFRGPRVVSVGGHKVFYEPKLGAASATTSRENALEYLENKLDDQYHVPADRYEKLFGEWVAERDTDANIDYAIHCGDTRDAAAVFGKYQTILERITALYPMAVEGKQPSAAKLDAVFSATRDLVKRSYIKAVSIGASGEWGEAHLPDAKESGKLGEVLLKIADTILPGNPCELPDQKLAVSPIFSSWIAACIISAWADQVPVIMELVRARLRRRKQ